MKNHHVLLFVLFLCFCPLANAQSLKLIKSDRVAAAAAGITLTPTSAAMTTDSLAQRVVVTQNADGTFSAVAYNPRNPEDKAEQDAEMIKAWIDSALLTNPSDLRGFFEEINKRQNRELLR